MSFQIPSQILLHIHTARMMGSCSRHLLLVVDFPHAQALKPCVVLHPKYDLKAHCCNFSPIGSLPPAGPQSKMGLTIKPKETKRKPLPKHWYLQPWVDMKAVPPKHRSLTLSLHFFHHPEISHDDASTCCVTLRITSALLWFLMVSVFLVTDIALDWKWSGKHTYRGLNTQLFTDQASGRCAALLIINVASHDRKFNVYINCCSAEGCIWFRLEVNLMWILYVFMFVK